MSQSTLDAFWKETSTGGEAEKPSGGSRSKPAGERDDAAHTPPEPKPELKVERRVVRNPDGSIDEIVETPGKPTIIFHKRPGVRIFREHVNCPLTIATHTSRRTMICGST